MPKLDTRSKSQLVDQTRHKETIATMLFPNQPAKQPASKQMRVTSFEKSFQCTAAFIGIVQNYNETNNPAAFFSEKNPPQANNITEVMSGTIKSAFSLLCQADEIIIHPQRCLLYTSPSPRDQRGSRMPSSA